jgi:large subunit ribosomal protein L24
MKDQKKTRSALKKGDSVIVIAGGNKKKRPLKGQVAKIVGFSAGGERVLLDGLNLFVRHQKASGPDKPAGKTTKAQGVHISNVMYYVEKSKTAVRLCHKVLGDGKKVRGYKDPESGEFVQI